MECSCFCCETDGDDVLYLTLHGFDIFHENCIKYLLRQGCGQLQFGSCVLPHMVSKRNRNVTDPVWVTVGEDNVLK